MGVQTRKKCHIDSLSDCWFSFEKEIWFIKKKFLYISNKNDNKIGKYKTVAEAIEGSWGWGDGVPSRVLVSEASVGDENS